MGVVEVVVDETVRNTGTRVSEGRLAVPLLHRRLVCLRLRRLQARRVAEAAEVRTHQARGDVGEAGLEEEEQVADELLRAQSAVGGLEGLQRRPGSGTANDPEVAVDLGR